MPLEKISLTQEINANSLTWQSPWSLTARTACICSVFLQGEKKKYILIPELFATRYLSMALQGENLAFISVSFPSLAATTENTVHPFSLSVGTPLYL